MSPTSAAGGGYSGTPLFRKLGVKPGATLVLSAAPAGWEIPDLPGGVEPERRDRPGRPEPTTTSSSVAAAADTPPAAATPPAGPIIPAEADLVAGPIDVCVAFCRDPAALRAAVAAYAEAIRPAGALWIAWPRRAAGHRSDVTENLIRQVVLPLGLVDTKVAALDVDWSGLKVVWRRDRR
jgi:hypothetical protein